MRLVQFQTRWLPEHVQYWSARGMGDPEAQQLEEHHAPLGDLLRDYMRHLAIPWWKRLIWNAEWEIVEKLMRGALNDHATVVWIERKGA